MAEQTKHGVVHCVRLDDSHEAMLSHLSERLKMKDSQVMRLALLRLHQAEKRAEKSESK